MFEFKYCKEIIFDGFNWSFVDLGKAAKQLWLQGFTAVKTSPVQTCKPGPRYKWEFLYQPTGFEFGNMLGTWDEFCWMCDQFHKFDMRVYPDVVAKHVASEWVGSDKMIPSDCVSKRMLSFCRDYNQGYNADSRYECTEKDWGTVSLDVDDEMYNTELWYFLNKLLKACDGIRLDEMKHYKTISEGGIALETMRSACSTRGKLFSGECIFMHTEEQYKALEEYEQLAMVICHYRMPVHDNNRRIGFFESHDTCYSDTLGRYTAGLSNDERLRLHKESLRENKAVLFLGRFYDELPWTHEMRRANHLALGIPERTEQSWMRGL